MGSRGRGSALKINGLILVFLTLLSLLFSTHLAEAEEFLVGDHQGWTFNVEAWANGKTFKAGDELVFKYSPFAHNVVSVNLYGYKNCEVEEGCSKLYKSGSDRIKLRKGMNYFICGFSGHCQAGMKLAIRATK